MQWFRNEWGLQPGEVMRLFVRYGGVGGFTLGLKKDKGLKQPCISATKDDITFFIAEEDIWFLEDQSLLVDYDTTRDDIVFSRELSLPLTMQEK